MASRVQRDSLNGGVERRAVGEPRLRARVDDLGHARLVRRRPEVDARERAEDRPALLLLEPRRHRQQRPGHRERSVGALRQALGPN